MPAPLSILAIDQGTTSSRAMLFDALGQVRGISQREYPQFYPQPGWVEQDGETIWNDTLAVCREVVGKVGSVENIAAIGITNQRETILVWNRETGKPIHRAIVWQDRRTADSCAELKAAGHEPAIRAKTGLLLDPYFSATKLRWVLDHVPGARASAEKGELAAGTVDCFLLWNLTRGRVHATDITNASRTLLFNIATQSWDDELLELFNIPRAILPDVRENVAEFGVADKEWFGREIPIMAMVGDQQAASFGQACFSPGMWKSTYGTGCFVLMNTGNVQVNSKHKLLATAGYKLDGKLTYVLEGSIFVAGSAIKWLRDQVGLITHAADTQKAAEAVTNTGGVYLVPAFAGLGAPHWDPHSRGMISGMTLDTRREHIIRAVLEAVAYQTRDLMAAFEGDTDGKITPGTLRVDGGMVANDWLCQFLADMLGIPVERPKVTETTALGAAYMAGIGAGIYSGIDAVANAWQCEKRFEPGMDAGTRDALYSGWQEAVARCRGVAN